MKNILFLLVIGFSLGSCAQSASNADETSTPKDLDSLQTAYFASGCFWCVEAVFESVEGVEEAVSGYAGGTETDPSYELVCSGRSRHAEVVKVYYDSSKVSYATLVDVFFHSHDPSTKNAQGPDHGPQYRSIAFYQTESEKALLQKKIKAFLEKGTFTKITTEVTPFEKFYPAEDYHQNYERLHPNQPYIRSVSIPRLNKFKAEMPEVLKGGH